ncbi:MAG: AmmeMemoRadiSam system radical SAM enzyme [Candidatus Desulfofervidaceae bacterium]|nr:AmmeMemoRadiSam system radical SAM enzyme [Candidatus Desulfofervidaceae bacterium]
MKEAMLYEELAAKKVRCKLCAHHCLIPEGKRGICGVRENQKGKLYSLVYDKVVAKHNDPIEKKPLYHFYPRSLIFSIATVGCNFRCLFCQNADISQMPKEEGRILGWKTTPEEIVAEAITHGASSIAYTYTEPTIFFELAYDTAKLAAAKGLKNVFVSNGYMSKEALEIIKPYLHAANIDLKSFREKYYKEICGAKLQPVLDTISNMVKTGIWVELTTLLIPTLNDSEEELRDIARWIYQLSPDIPWHISRFYPTYRLTHLPPTAVEAVRRAREIGLEEGLRYVYTGNVLGDDGENTYCHHCGALVIARYGYTIGAHNIKDGRCINCGTKIPGVGL